VARPSPVRETTVRHDATAGDRPDDSAAPLICHVRSEFPESMIGSEFASDLEKDLLSRFSQFADRNRLGMSCCVVHEIFIFRTFL
jgi:hypothetical protein